MAVSGVGTQNPELLAQLQSGSNGAAALGAGANLTSERLFSQQISHHQMHVHDPSAEHMREQALRDTTHGLAPDAAYQLSHNDDGLDDLDNPDNINSLAGKTDIEGLDRLANHLEDVLEKALPQQAPKQRKAAARRAAVDDDAAPAEETEGIYPPTSDRVAWMTPAAVTAMRRYRALLRYKGSAKGLRSKILLLVNRAAKRLPPPPPSSTHPAA